MKKIKRAIRQLFLSKEERESLRLLDKFDKNYKWFLNHYEELKKEFKGEWIAVFNEEVIAHYNEIDELFNFLFNNLSSEEIVTTVVEMVPNPYFEYNCL